MILDFILGRMRGLTNVTSTSRGQRWWFCEADEYTPQTCNCSTQQSHELLTPLALACQWLLQNWHNNCRYFSEYTQLHSSFADVVMYKSFVVVCFCVPASCHASFFS
jgi:hypothetical protein